MLVALGRGGRIEASVAERGPAYACPNCRAAVILRKGQIKVHHFAHKPPTSCAWASGETAAHLLAKSTLCAGFRAQGLTADVEVVVLSSGGDRRADVRVFGAPAPPPVAIEIQHTPLSFDQIANRTAAYQAVGTPVLWVSLLNAKSWESAELRDGRFVIERYSVRPWERWAHTYGMGELWFFDVVDAKLWRGELKAHHIEVPYSSWHDSYGNEESAGGYTRVSRKWRELHLYGPHEPDQVGLSVVTRQPWSGQNYQVPGGRIVKVVPF